MVWPQIEFLNVVKLLLFLRVSILIKFCHLNATMLMIRVVCIITHHIISLILFNYFLSVTVAGSPCWQDFNDSFRSIVLIKGLLRLVKLISPLSNQLIQTIVIFLILIVSLNQTLILDSFYCNINYNANTYARDHSSYSNSYDYHN